MSVSENENKNLDLALKLSIKKNETQNQAHNSLESKVGILLGFIGVIMGSIVILVKGDICLIGLNIFTIGLLLVFVSFMLLVFASQSRIYLDPPDFSAFFSEESLNKENSDLKNGIIADFKKCYKENQKPHELKSKLFNFSIYSFLFGILFLFLGILEK